MQHETVEGEQASLDNPLLCKKVMYAPIVKNAYAPITPDVALEHSVCLATKLAEIICSRLSSLVQHQVLSNGIFHISMCKDSSIDRLPYTIPPGPDRIHIKHTSATSWTSSLTQSPLIGVFGNSDHRTEWPLFRITLKNSSLRNGMFRVSSAICIGVYAKSSELLPIHFPGC